MSDLTRLVRERSKTLLANSLTEEREENLLLGDVFKRVIATAPTPKE